MQSTVQYLLKNVFHDYVDGLEQAGNGGGSVEFHDLSLRTDRINEDMDEDGSCPFSINSGSIGFVSLVPTWTGGIEIKLDAVTINMSFNAIKAMKAGLSYMKGEEVGDASPAHAARRAPPPRKELKGSASNSGIIYGAGSVNGGQQFCPAHRTSEKREKGHPVVKQCMECKQHLQTNYVNFTLCPSCSGKSEKCMICGNPSISSMRNGAPANGQASVPSAKAARPPPPPPRNVANGNGSGNHLPARREEHATSERNGLQAQNGYSERQSLHPAPKTSTRRLRDHVLDCDDVTPNRLRENLTARGALNGEALDTPSNTGRSTYALDRTNPHRNMSYGGYGALSPQTRVPNAAYGEVPGQNSPWQGGNNVILSATRDLPTHNNLQPMLANIGLHA